MSYLMLSKTGRTLYHHASGLQHLGPNAPPLDPDSTIVLGSAGKFITHIAALQLVEQGAIGLDEPVYQHLPELESSPLITEGTGGEAFTLRPPCNKITLRHLLLHTSGLSSSDVPLVSEYLASNITKPEFEDSAHFIVKNFSVPLIFEPGGGFSYGYSIHWTQLLVTRLTGNFLKYIQEHIFNPLGMTSSTYMPRDSTEIWNKRLRMVERQDGELIPADDASQGLICSMSDMEAILGDLIMPSPKLLKQQQHIDLLFNGQLAPLSMALKDLRRNPENYAFCAGAPGDAGAPLVNWSAAGLTIENDIPLSHFPKGTVTWEGMPNVLWAMNRDKGLAMFFATQLIPVGDEKANDLALTFMKNAWKTFA
jgi:CubicO group peptidase (beta-lactamase class C family)